MSEKVKLTKEQAESVIIAKEYMERTSVITTHHLHPSTWTDQYKGLNGMPLDTLIRALYIGYEVEETPEEKVRQQYEIPCHFHNKDNDTPADIYRKGIKFALDTLNIKIDGVNA